MTEAGRDRWAEWLLRTRHGGNAAVLHAMLQSLAPMRDRVLGNARIAPGQTVLDVGTGDGLLAFGALDRVGADGTVIFSDVSPELLAHAEAGATELGVASRCRFVVAAAEELTPIPDASVDVVTMRAVLLCVAEKRRVFDACRRVLRRGGRLSICEPINAWLYADPDALWGYDVSPVRDIAEKLRAVFAPAGDPMTGYDERDLLALAAAGFAGVHLDLEVDLEPMRPVVWPSFVNATFSPAAPTIAAALASAVSSEEQERFVAHLRPLVEQGVGSFPRATAYLRATNALGDR